MSNESLAARSSHPSPPTEPTSDVVGGGPRCIRHESITHHELPPVPTQVAFDESPHILERQRGRDFPFEPRDAFYGCTRANDSRGDPSDATQGRSSAGVANRRPFKAGGG